MFYGIGSYGIAIALYTLGPTWTAVGAGLAAGLPLAVLLALAIGLFSLRVQAIFFAMITLAVASAFLVWPRSCHGSPAARTAAASSCPSCCAPALCSTRTCSASRSRAAR